METPSVIPGIGSYMDRESARKSDDRLRMHLGERLDQAIGTMEWLKIELTKKRSLERAVEMDELSEHVERLSEIIESSSKDYSALSGSEEVDEVMLNKLFGLDTALTELVGEMELGIRVMMGGSLAPNSKDVKKIGEILANMEQKTKKRGGLLKSS